MPASNIASQIEQTADYNPPNVYALLGFFTALQQSTDNLSSSYIPVSQIPFVARNLKPFIIGLIPPSANVTGNVIDRSATVANLTGGPAGTSGDLVSGSGDDVRAKALALAQSYVGLSNAPSTVGAYGNLLANPAFNNAATAAALVNQASCAPTVRGWFDQLGVQAPELQAPYKWSQAPADVLAIANRAGANYGQGGKISQTPQPGDVYYITGSAQHMGIITSVTGDAASGKFTVTDISGGQQVGADNAGNVFKGIGTATRTFTQDQDPNSPTYGTWFVKRNDGLDIVGEGDNPLGRQVGAMVDTGKVLAGIPPSQLGAGVPPGNTLWQGAGSNNAQAASQQIAKTSGTGITAGDLTSQLTAVQQTVAQATKTAIDQMANTPPLKMLVNPASFRVSSEKITSDGNWGRNGPIIEHWGEQQDKIDGSGKVAGFYAIDTNAGNSPGLTRMVRNVSAAYENFLSLYLIYRNNGGIWLPDPTSPQTSQIQNLSLVGSVYIYYDSIMYVGSFSSFTITESDAAPFTVEYNFSFSVRASFVLDSTAPQLNYNTPSGLPPQPGT